jgi:hypothetical protein
MRSDQESGQNEEASSFPHFASLQEIKPPSEAGVLVDVTIPICQAPF